MEKTVVVAATVQRARYVAEELGIKDAFSTSPSSIRGGSSRGLCDVRSVLVDESALPLSDDVRSPLMVLLSCTGGDMYSTASLTGFSEYAKVLTS
jgi:hypothetical protein